MALNFDNLPFISWGCMAYDPEWLDHKGKDSNWTILQAGNLYMFTMHNPIKFIDPWGLHAVLLQYIVQSNHGTMTEMPTGFCFFTGEPAAARFSITMGGRTRVLSVGNNTSMNILIHGDHMLIYYSVLMREFGLSRTQATHQPGDPFSSPDMAAIAFALMHTQNMSDTNRARRGWLQPDLEIAAFIYSITTGIGRSRTTHYTFGNPWEGGAISGHFLGPNVVLGYFMRTLDPRRVSPFRSRAGFVHTHPDNLWQFSDQDMNIAHGQYVGHSAMPVFSALINNDALEVRRFDRTMNRTRQRNWGGRLIF